IKNRFKRASILLAALICGGQKFFGLTTEQEKNVVPISFRNISPYYSSSNGLTECGMMCSRKKVLQAFFVQVHGDP
ncbi:MAG: hypothetical protein IPQ23_00005, partial [Cytophagaceae bacterium]|nr:hypothetical protein [Cytophagaceae bacterium]